MAEEEEWLVTGSLGKGHAWEAVLRGGGTDRGDEMHRSVSEPEREGRGYTTVCANRLWGKCEQK